jgi:allophanate hydrolase
VPRADQLEFFGHYEARQLFGNTIAGLHAHACKVIEIDFSLFMRAAKLLYQGPWVAERWLVVHDMIEHQPEAMLQVTRSIIASARNFSAADTFAAQYQLAALRRAVEPILASVTAVMTPTIGSPFTCDEVAESPIQLNTDLGYYTNFMNLLDLAALAVPAAPFANGLPNGITLFADRGSDLQLLQLARQFFPGEKSDD